MIERDIEKSGYTIGELYRLKELYRVQGENVCWMANNLLLAMKDLVAEHPHLAVSMRKLRDAVNMFEGKDCE